MKTSLLSLKICLIFKKRLVGVHREEREAGEDAPRCVLGKSGKGGDGEGKVMHVSVELSSNGGKEQRWRGYKSLFLCGSSSL